MFLRSLKLAWQQRANQQSDAPDIAPLRYERDGNVTYLGFPPYSKDGIALSDGTFLSNADCDAIVAEVREIIEAQQTAPYREWVRRETRKVLQAAQERRCRSEEEGLDTQPG